MNDFCKQYGSALYSLCKDEGKCEKILKELEVIEKLLIENKEYTMLLDNPRLKLEERLKLSDEAFGNFDEISLNFIKILVEKKSSGMLIGCIKEFIRMYDKDNNIERATVVSYVPLSEKQLEEITKKAEKMLSKKVYLKNEVSKDIIGGIILKFSDSDIDGSLKGRLKSMESHLKSLTFQKG